MSRIDTDALKDRYRLSDVVGRRTALRRAGRQLKGLCPFHAEKSASFFVDDANGSYHCYGCGAHGDLIRFVAVTEGVSFRAACEMIAGADLPIVPEAEKVKAREEEAAAREASIAEARRVWEVSVELGGTPGEVYMRTRGLEPPYPPRLRFALTPSWWNLETGEVGPDRPAVICKITNGADRFLGVQRIFLLPDGSGKARMANPKLSLGRPRGGAIRLGPAAEHVITIEGPEDGVTVWRMVDGQSVWVACGTSMLPLIEFPPVVRYVTVAGDNNKPGREAVKRSLEAYSDKGLLGRSRFPDPDFEDWNDMLRDIRREGARK